MDINFQAPVNSLGYGQVGYNVLDKLSNIANVTFFPIGTPQPEKPEYHQVIKRGIDKQIDFNYLAPTVKVWHEFALADMVGKGLRVGFPFFELTSFNQFTRHQLNFCDKLLVASNWAKNIIDEFYQGECHVVPLGINPLIFNPNIVVKKPRNTFVICVVGKWEYKKGYDKLSRIFCKAFSISDNVELHIVADNPFLPEQEQKRLENEYYQTDLGHKIFIHKRQQTQEQLRDIMAFADVGISLSRSEGFNLPALEFLALGKNLIITNWSAHKEFATAENSYLIEIDATEPARDGRWYTEQNAKDSVFASIGKHQEDQAVEHLRTCYNNWRESPNQINQAGVETGRRFTWDHTASKILSILKD